MRVPLGSVLDFACSSETGLPNLKIPVSRILIIGLSRNLLMSVPRSSLADLEGGFEYRPDREYSSQFMRSNCCQIHGSNASAVCAIRISAELARRNLGLQVRRQGLSREREYTILRTVWWRGKLPNDRLRHA